MRNGQVLGLKKPATLQVLNKQTRGLFLKESEMLLAGWTAKAADFEKGSVTFNHTHKFGLKNNSSETGVLFVKPRICILVQSPVLVEDTQDGNRLIGELGSPQINELFYGDKKEAEASEDVKRRYQARTKSLVYILDKKGNIAHKNPVVLTTKGLVSMEFFSKESGYGLFLAQAETSNAERQGLPLTNVKFSQEFYCQLIWEPEFGAEPRGPHCNEICAVVSQPVPTPETLESFAASEEVVAEFDKILAIPGADQFYVTHAQKEAERLGGRYGIAEGYLSAGESAQMLLEPEVNTITVSVADDSAEFLAH